MGELEDYSVTVTIPVYNSSEFIDDCLDNLSRQTYDIFEIIIVVDDRTSDDSVDKLKKKADLFDNMRIIMQNDGKGLASARNIGIKEAKGDIIWFLDVDDIPHPDFLKELIDIMRKTDADTVICNHFQSFKKEMKAIPENKYTFKVVDGCEAMENYTDYPIYSWSRIQKRIVFDEDSLFREHKAAEDIEQTIRQLAVSKKVCYYNKPLFTYYKRKKSATRDRRKDEIESMEETVRSVLSFVKSKYPESYEELQRKMLLGLMRQSTFAKYRSFCEGYRRSISHLILENIKDKSFEMRVYSFSKTLYYIILFPFSHYLWDRKKGMWDRNAE